MCTLTALTMATGLTAASGCRQQLVQPNAEMVSLSTVSVNNPCTRVAFSITDNNSVTATMPSTSCGPSPFKIVSGGPMTWKQNPNRLLKIPVQILNKDEISIPAYYVPRIVLRPVAKVVSNPAGTSPATMVPLNADSTRADGTTVWLMSLPDSVFVELPGAFPPGSTTHTKTLEFRINSPTIAGVFEFDLVGARFEIADSVPAVAPDSIPIWIHADSSFNSEGVQKNVLVVLFTTGASQVARKAAIDSVQGTVVGGYRLGTSGDGWYIIRVVGAPTQAVLDSLSSILRRQPAVRSATLNLLVAPTWRRPDDGAGWRRNDWKVDATQADSTNWGLEDISAPLAWGCDVGDHSVPMAIVDRSFYSNGDYKENVVGSIPIPHSADTSTFYHGAMIANIIAARGNDLDGMTGVMWNSSVRLYDAGAGGAMTLIGVVTAIQRAHLDGARVINISLSFPSTGTPSDTLRKLSATDQLYTVLDTSFTSAPPPLVVISAGNDNTDAWRAGLPAILDSFPNTVLVAAASTRPIGGQRDRWGGSNFNWNPKGGSNHGPLVQIYAPGRLLPFWDDRTSTIVSNMSGSSFAAAYITGIAGLLLSFDPLLASAAVKQLIISGASDAQKSVTNHANRFVADAHASLRRAARRTGAPLCGNRVWVQNLRSIVVDRGGSSETIQAFPSPDTLGFVFASHGGRRLDFQILQDGGAFTGLHWGAGGWSAIPTTPLPDTLWSGTTWSFFRRTHDGDSVVGPAITSFGGTAGATSASFVVTLGTSSQSGRLLANMSIPLVAPTFVSGRRNAQVDSAGNFIQYVESTAPVDQIFNSTFETGIVRAVPSPFGDRVLVAFSYRDNPVSAPTAWAPGAFATPIGNEWSYQERFAQYNTVSGKTKVWSIPWGGGTPLPLWERTGRSVGWIGLSEAPFFGGHEMVMGIGQVDGAAAPVGAGGYTSCQVEYVNLLTGDSLRTPRTVPPATCGVGLVETGTIAPLRTAAKQRKRN